MGREACGHKNEYLDNVCTYDYTERQGDGGMRKEQMKHSQSTEAKYVILLWESPEKHPEGGPGRKRGRTRQEEGRQCVPGGKDQRGDNGTKAASLSSRE